MASTDKTPGGAMKLSRLFLYVSVLVILVCLGSVYSWLSFQLKDQLTDGAKQRINAVSHEKLDQLTRLFKSSHRDVKTFYHWPHLEQQLQAFWKQDNEVNELALRHNISQFAEQHDYAHILLFNEKQQLIMWVNSSIALPSSALKDTYLTRHLLPYLRAASDNLQTSVSPFFPSLESLQQSGSMNSEIINKRVSFIVAPLMAQETMLGSIAFARQASETELFNHGQMSFDHSGQIVFVEQGDDAVYGLFYPNVNNGRPKILVDSAVNEDSALSRVLNKTSGSTFFVGPENQEQLGQWRYIPEFNMGVLIYQSADEVYGGLKQFHLLALVALISTLVVAFVLGWGYLRNIYRKLYKVSERLAAVTHYTGATEKQGQHQIELLNELLVRVEQRIQKDNDVLLSAKQRLRFFMKELEDQRFAFDQHCIIIVADADGTFTDANKQFSDLSGYSRSELIGSSFKRFGGDYQNERILVDIFDTMHRGKVWHGELSLVKRGGDRYWLETTFVPFINEDGTLRNMVAIHTDITEQKLAYADMIHQAQYDSLTGLPNRALLLDRLGQMLRNARRNKTQVAVLFLDLDDFKKINDSLGHELGDELLVEVGRRLKALVRNQDTIGRLGGDEFLVLLDSPEYREDVEVVAKKIIEAIKAPILIEDYELVVGVSIGIAIYPDDGDTESEMLRHADSAMYNAKKMGRNTWSYFTEAMNKEVARRLEIESWMNGAIERGEFSVMFQPIVSVMSGKFATVEALVRWNHPQGGHISPDEFIPIAEHSGFIMDIGRFVLEESLDLAAEWRNRYGSDLIVALNASPRQFRDPNWHGGIEEQLAKRGLSTRNIEFEITEGVLISGHENVERALQEFSDLGIAIAMDDFGTGYSSLSYLRNYPFDTLKIDRSFVSDIVEDHADYELVSAAIAMAHGLGLEVVAEGVETIEQYELLYHRRCDYAQGYLFSPPVSGGAILAMGGRLPIDSRIRQQRMASAPVTTKMNQNGGEE